jgi:hypothetical protein
MLKKLSSSENPALAIANFHEVFDLHAHAHHTLHLDELSGEGGRYSYQRVIFDGRVI